jgi:hypothetical protein
MRQINKSRIEIYVESYLKHLSFRKSDIFTINSLKKAAAYIEYALTYRTCDFDEPILNLYTLRDNQFTKTIYHMIRNINLDRWKKSLWRTVDILNKRINGVCCNNEE